MQTETPYWLGESYSSAINRGDVGMVTRNLMLAEITKAMLVFFFRGKSKCLDYGGGYGLFVRMMRDKGFDFYWSDSHCENIFAKDFEMINDNEQFDFLTSFEVFEHLQDPVEEAERMLKHSKNIFFSTELIPASSPKPGEWWYYGLDHGQHISFYTKKSLEKLAEKFNLNLYSNGKNIHLITERKINKLLFKFLSYSQISKPLNLLFRKKSFLEADHQLVLKRIAALIPEKEKVSRDI